MDRLEKGSGQTVVTLQEAKALIKEDDDLIIAVYDYWLNKRLKTQHPLIPHVKTEARHGVANHNPYIAFRRRTEKMQTRKNRKNDESSYEKMLKLKRDLTRAVTLLEMVKRREKSKRELLHLTLEVFEKRYQAGDYSGSVVTEALQQRPVRPAFTPIFPNSWIKDDSGMSNLTRKERRQYKKRRHKSSSKNNHGAGTGSAPSILNYSNAQELSIEGEGGSSEEDLIQPVSPSDGEEEDEGVFSFRRKRGCQYYAPIDNSEGSWCSSELDTRLRFYPTSIRQDADVSGSENIFPVGPCRLRRTRGGTLALDRMNLDDLRQFCRVMKIDTAQALESLANVQSSNETSEPVESSSANSTSEVTRNPTVPVSSSNSPVTKSSPELESSSTIPCWYSFRPQSPDRTAINEESTSALMELLNEETSKPTDEDSELARLVEQLSDPTKCHLNVVLDGVSRPISYPVSDFDTDPPLYQDPLVSHCSRTNLSAAKSIPPDEQMLEESDSAYLMQLNPEDSLLVPADVIPDVVTTPWFASVMDVDGPSAPHAEDSVDKKPELSVLNSFLNPAAVGQPPTPSYEQPPSSSTLAFHLTEIKVETDNTANSTEDSTARIHPRTENSENRPGGNNGKINSRDLVQNLLIAYSV